MISAKLVKLLMVKFMKIAFQCFETLQEIALVNKKSLTLKSKDAISIKESLVNSLFIKVALEIESFCGEPKACNPMNGQNLLKMISN